ncbi:MAG: AmmeMemoRadiSam system protein A [Terriglobales bacterium]|jgi:AmmeMemoRadiSam system protein A
MSKLSENFVAPIADKVIAGKPTVEDSAAAPEFTAEQRHTLLSIARNSIASALIGNSLPDSPPADSSFPALTEPRGVFTTLYLEGQLRGCVGYALPIRPLFRAVAETARAAAFEDTRFWPLTPEEAPGLQISLSVLSRLFPIAASEVEVGRHGLLISSGLRRGLLLPQVPVEHGWDRETFLDQTCHKAGLPLDAWRKSTTIEAFTAEVFGDEGAPS